jgi:hypothetical protein
MTQQTRKNLVYLRTGGIPIYNSIRRFEKQNIFIKI